MTPSPPRWDIALICGCAIATGSVIAGGFIYMAVKLAANLW